ncbi:MAG: M15 family metallopeptidase [Chitinophagales bacterium]|nr:M15 family metallopeptidase [Chitinophagales bacterium]
MSNKYSKDLSRIIQGYYGIPATKKIVSEKTHKVVITQSYDNGVSLNMSYSTEEYVEYQVQQSRENFVEYEVMGASELPLVQQSSIPYYDTLSDDVFIEDFTETASDHSNNVSVQKSQEYDFPIEQSLEDKEHHMISFEEEKPKTSNVKKSSSQSVDEDDFLSDMKAILRGEKRFEKEQGMVEAKSTPTKNPPPPKEEETQNLRDFKSEHAIFDKIAQSMQYANAYDLGSFDLEQRFDDFDRIEELKEKKSKGTTSKKKSNAMSDAELVFEKADHSDYIEDLDLMKSLSEKETFFQSLEDTRINNPDWPSRPTTMRPYTLSEKKATFGTFEYTTTEGDDIHIDPEWVRDNIVSVEIPQLIGKINGSKADNKVRKTKSMQFHRKGATQLAALFKAWEDAGLLDRIITFNGDFVPRFVRLTKAQKEWEERNGRRIAFENRSLSNHSWGTAFDINAEWNRREHVPALLSKEGCVRELVEIAYQHGFFWGGHFKGKSIDGMHFELGKIIQ